MKKILLMALTMTGITFFSAEAQERKATEVCSISKTKGASCYHTKYAENFKVCKDDYQYFICGETPTYANSTKRGNYVPMPKQVNQDMSYAAQNMDQAVPASSATPDALIAPQSQSYPAPTTISMSSESAYEGYYPQKHYIKVSYSDNVAEETHAPYEGLPSPQYDGPAKNAERNINADNPNANLAPITGRPE